MLIRRVLFVVQAGADVSWGHSIKIPASRFVNERNVKGNLTLVTQQKSRMSPFSILLKKEKV